MKVYFAGNSITPREERGFYKLIRLRLLSYFWIIERPFLMEIRRKKNASHRNFSKHRRRS